MEKRCLTDPAIAAVFKAHPRKTFIVSPVKLPDGKVGFDIEGINIDETLQEIYSNMQIPILDFLQALKTLRGAIFALKGGRS